MTSQVTPEGKSMFSADDHRHMAEALRLAGNGLYTTDPNPRVGCVLVRDGRVVGRGWHARTGGPHAEIVALQDAGEAARGATAYVTLEPCCHHGRTPPCSHALVDAGVSGVVAAMRDPNPQVAGQGLAELQAAGITVRDGLLQEQAAALNPGFIKRMTEGRPWVRSKLAMSLDGRTAMASGESQWITGPDARRDVQRLRARSSVIMTGIGTVLSDDPSLTVRERDIGEHPPEGGWRQPLRLVVDPHLSTPLDARMLRTPGDTLIATSSEDEVATDALTEAGAEVLWFPGDGDAVRLDAILAYLGSAGANEVLLETGAVLGGGMLNAGLVDELIIYMAPVLMGDSARGLFHLPGIQEMRQRLALEITDLRPVGRDWRISARPGGS